MTTEGFGRRLGELRKEAGLVQGDLGKLLRPERPLSTSLISSWEKRSGAVVPPREWIDKLALVYAVDWTARDEAPRLLPTRELSETERARHRELQAELSAMQSEAGMSEAGAGSGSDLFWKFNDDLPITIIASALPDDELETNPYANPRHPNYMPLLAFSDGDSVMEVYGQLRAQNPDVEVKYIRPDDVRANPDILTGHVVIIGGGDRNEYAQWFAQRMNLPVAGEAEGEEVPTGEPTADATFTVQPIDLEGRPVGDAVIHEPIFEGTVSTYVLTIDEKGATVRQSKRWPKLVYDVALVARQPNPANLEATATLCYGLYSRGTFGASRVFTDPNLVDANERYRRERFGEEDSYWFLFRVACNWGIATTPDLRRAFLRLQEWPPRQSSSKAS